MLGLLLDRRRGQVLLARDETLEPAYVERYRRWVERRAAREPAQHISGEQEFHGLAFAVTPDVLIPRPETELLVDEILARAPRDATLVDLGTGSGCIVITALVKRPDLIGLALDRSAAALAVARRNAKAHGVERRVSFEQGDFGRPPADWNADVVASNPPYVAEPEWRELEPEVRDHDPKAALVPGPTGLEAYRRLPGPARELLGANGLLLLELGAGQADDVRTLVEAAGYEDVTVKSDLNGIPRVLGAVLGSAR